MGQMPTGVAAGCHPRKSFIGWTGVTPAALLQASAAWMQVLRPCKSSLLHHTASLELTNVGAGTFHEIANHGQHECKALQQQVLLLGKSMPNIEWSSIRRSTS